LPVNLNVLNNGSPKNENRHQAINLSIAKIFNSKDTTGTKNSGKRELSYQLNFENNNFKYFDKNPSADSSFYGFFQTNNRGLRHFINHKVLRNEAHYKEAFFGDLNNSPLVLDVYLRHRLNFVNQEPQFSAINNFFDINNWDFGDRFYMGELTTYILNTVAPDLANIVIIPRQSSQAFGSLFEIQSSSDEILISAATVDDIEIVSAITASEIGVRSNTSAQVENTQIITYNSVSSVSTSSGGY
jgi:hypothetical protein